jgi:hypothetical protein
MTGLHNSWKDGLDTLMKKQPILFAPSSIYANYSSLTLKNNPHREVAIGLSTLWRLAIHLIFKEGVVVREDRGSSPHFMFSIP